MSDHDIYDLLVIGGGINGAGIARDAAGRNLKVMLVDAHDLASATSSASTKIIHGGLRYLEQFDFRLVREALKEREILLKNAPHIIWPLEFILPHEPHLRPSWMIRLGLFLYDHLAKRKKLPASLGVDLNSGLYGAPLKDRIKRGFSYADGWVDDARLVVFNALSAKEQGAVIKTYTTCTHIAQQKNMWYVTLRDTQTGKENKAKAKAIVNAAGPWAADFINDAIPDMQGKHQLKLVKGSHIIVPKLFEGSHCYILQHEDGRIVFAIPYERNFTFIGTTDVPYEGDPAEVMIEQGEINYLCNIINEYFKTQINPEDVIGSFSGVRPLLDDGQEKASKVTRDYKLVMEEADLPFLTIYGGKITTYRKLAEAAVNMLMPGSET